MISNKYAILTFYLICPVSTGFFWMHDPRAIGVNTSQQFP